MHDADMFYDGNGNVVSNIDKMGYVSMFTYDDCGQVVSLVDKAGNVITR